MDGVQNVAASLDLAGTLAFNTFTARHGSATRWVNYDFSRPLDPLNLFRPPQDHTQNYHFSTGKSQYNPFVPVQYLVRPVIRPANAAIWATASRRTAARAIA